MQEAVKLGEILTKLISDRCENCGRRYRYKGKKWCKRCIDVYYRKEHITPESVDRAAVGLVEALYANATLDDIDLQIRSKLLNKREPEQDLFLYGLVGRGKTHIMAALIRHYLGEGFEIARICFDDFCVNVRSAMSFASKVTEREMVEPLKQVDMLFIDDLGLRSKQETDFAYVTFFSILDKRQERMLPTFISSNKDLDRLRESFDERIVSRLQTALIIEIKGKDRRLND